MYKILNNKRLAPHIYCMEIEAPDIAKKRRPGQFVIVRVDEKGERIPLTIASADIDTGSISIIFQAVGRTTQKMAGLKKGNFIRDVAGPLGRPTDIKKFGRVVCVGGGVGIALIYPLIRALKDAGNEVISIVSARTKEMLILLDEIKEMSDEIKIATDDGSSGYHGFPTDILSNLIEDGYKIDLVLAVGPVPMMEAISNVTRPYNIKTVVSLNPIMVDGTGMCGGCRVTVGGETKFTCVDGPEFDGHKVNFKELAQRLRIYEREEKSEAFSGIRTEKIGICKAEILTGEKGKVPRQKMAEQPAHIRVKNFHEVAFGFTQQQAKLEAERCLQCRNPLCQKSCPVHIDIPGFISQIKEGNYSKAIRIIKGSSCLPAVCGRVCPAEDNCENGCVLKKKAESIAIGALERFVSDMEMASGRFEIPEIKEEKGIKIAVVGSGPAGISCAGDLARMGYSVTLFEAFHKAGGVLIYGIPEFRLPKDIVEREIEYLKKIGVDIRLNSVIGKLFTVDELFSQGYKSVFIGTGAGLPLFLGVPGENLNGVMSANEFLTRSNLMKAYDLEYDTPIPCRAKVAVIGGGNVAMDAARTARRLGADEVVVIYRRSREEMPARPVEIHHGEEEGIRFQYLSSPLAFIGDDKKWVKAIRCQRMRLGEKDTSGRRRPVPIPGDEFTLEVEEVIIAIGNRPNPLISDTTSGLATGKGGNIIADPDTGKTSKEGVFAGGDIVTGSATVISAMGAGRRGAVAIDRYIRNI